MTICTTYSWIHLLELMIIFPVWNLNHIKLKLKESLWTLTGIYLVQPWFFPFIHKSEHVMNTLCFVYLIEIIDNEQS